MNNYIIDKRLSSKVLMAGNYYKHHHPGGISAVVQYWESYIENLQYYPTYKLSNVLVRAWYFVASYIKMAFKMAIDKEVRIVHLHTAADGSFWRKVCMTKLAKRFGKKVVLHVHASRFKDFYNESSVRKKAWIDEELRRVDVLIVLSESWRRWFESIGVDAGKIEVLHNITPYPVDMPQAKRQDHKVHLLFMGEIGQRKGVFDIIRSLAKYKEVFKGKVELRIGGNKMEEELKENITDNNLQDMVIFEGWVGGQKKLELLNWADVFILPSFNEGLPISILEAMSYSHPIISTPVGGIPEVVETNVNGVIVSPGNEEEIFAAIKKYTDNPSLIISEGKESYKRAETYLPDYVLNHLKRIYENLI